MSHGSEGPLWAGGVFQENSARLPGEPPGTFFGDGGRPRDLFPLPFLMSWCEHVTKETEMPEQQGRFKGQ